MGKLVKSLFLTAVAALTVATCNRHMGNLWLYLGFTIVSNVLMLNGFRRRALFFDTFIGAFLWLGFWLKFSVYIAFGSGVFNEPVGLFNGSAGAFDKALLVSTSGIAAVLVASLLRERLFCYPDKLPRQQGSNFFKFYKKHRICILASFLLAVVFFAISNVWLGIYQRGIIPQTKLPFGLNGIYKWMLQFGLASFSALIVRFEIEINSKLSWVSVATVLLETFLSNISLLSRGMILNFSALAFGTTRMLQALQISRNRFVNWVAVFFFCVAFALSVPLVNFVRVYKGAIHETSDSPCIQAPLPSLNMLSKRMITSLFLDRWVGMEGVMAVSAYNQLGWKLWRDAWEEKFQDGKLSLYDSRLIDSPYRRIEITHPGLHHVSLPGMIAFLYYPGSLAFLFVGVFGCALVAGAVEIGVFYMCGRNLILCALIGQVIAYRLASFGYVPNQSYLYFGTVVMNLFLIAVLEHMPSRKLPKVV